MIELTLVTLGDPARLTGGYLYHQRLAAAANRYDANLRFVSFPERRFPALRARHVLRKALSTQPDVLVVDSIVAACLAPALAIGQPDVRMCAIVHQRPGGPSGRDLRHCIRAVLDLALYRRADLVVAASDWLAAELRGSGVLNDRLNVVNPGVDFPPKRSIRAGTGSIRFLCVANWVEPKGIHVLLEAMKMLPDQAGKLGLVGDTDIDPGYKRQIERQLADRGLARRVEVLGPIAADRMHQMYREADVFVLPAINEAFGTVFGEAMAHGLPPIGVRSGNLPHLIQDGVEGYVVAPGDARAVASAMLKLAADAALREEMGEAARHRAALLPSWEDCARTFFGLLHELVTRRRGRNAWPGPRYRRG